jgi:hypothetical protein
VHLPLPLGQGFRDWPMGLCPDLAHWGRPTPSDDGGW